MQQRQSSAWMERLKNELDYTRRGVPAGAAIETMEVIHAKAPCV